MSSLPIILAIGARPAGTGRNFTPAKTGAAAHNATGQSKANAGSRNCNCTSTGTAVGQAPSLPAWQDSWNLLGWLAIALALVSVFWLLNLWRKVKQNDQPRSTEQKKGDEQFAQDLLDGIVLINLSGWIIVALFWLAKTPGLSASGWAVLDLCGAGFAALGALVGFLFGFPKSAVTGDGHSQEQAQAQGNEGSSLRPNTNLEKISDWLTTVIAGIALSQIGQIPAYIEQFKTFINSSLAATTNGTVQYAGLVALGLLFFFGSSEVRVGGREEFPPPV
jgi:hypothetical protein